MFGITGLHSITLEAAKERQAEILRQFQAAPQAGGSLRGRYLAPLLRFGLLRTLIHRLAPRLVQRAAL